VARRGIAVSLQLNIEKADAPVRDRDTYPFFPVATHKFIVLSIFSFGLYGLYWSYQHWKRVGAESAEILSPFWRAFFAPLWNFMLFGDIRNAALTSGLKVRWHTGVLAGSYLLLSSSSRLPDPWSLLTLCAFVPLVPVQLAAERINALHGASVQESRNTKYSAANIILITCGGVLLFVLLDSLLGNDAA
jgi:quinol-cytochrome oxidoreductase complex cytochrome b subunit